MPITQWGGSAIKNKKKYNLPPYSVLMSVYDKELPANLNESLESMLMQTYPPEEIVLVCDGKLTCELNIIVKSFESEFDGSFKIIRREKNGGAGSACNDGIKACTCPYIVRMDSDDISLPDRCAKQMMAFALDPKLDMIGTYAEEFDPETGLSIAVRKTPLRQEQIMKYARRRNPFNRQTVAFRRGLAKKVGGYSNLRLCEDYEFAVRMLMGGAKVRNIPEPLVRYRVSEEDMRRRRSFDHTMGFIKVRRLIHSYGFTSFWDMFCPCAVQFALMLLPYGVTKRVYAKLRKK